MDPIRLAVVMFRASRSGSDGLIRRCYDVVARLLFGQRQVRFHFRIEGVLLFLPPSGEGGLKYFDRVSRRIIKHDFRSARAGQNVTAEMYLCLAQSFYLAAEII